MQRKDDPKSDYPEKLTNKLTWKCFKHGNKKIKSKKG